MLSYIHKRIAAFAEPWIPISIPLLAFFARAYRLGSQSLWADEAESIAVSSWPLLTLLVEHASDVHPPLYYVLLHFWTPLAGRSEFAVRYVSAFFGVLLIPLLYLVGKRLVGRRAGSIAALLAAVSPFYVRLAQEARMYTLVTFLSLLSSFFLLRLSATSTGDRQCGQNGLRRPASRQTYLTSLREGLGTGEGRLAVGYVIATAAAMYTHYFAVFVIMVQLVYVLLARWRQRTAIKPWLRRFSAAGLLYFPWLILMIVGILSVDPALRLSSQAADPNAPVGGLLATLLEGRAGMVSLPAIFKQCLITFGPSDLIGPQYAGWLTVGLVLIALVGVWRHPRPARLWKCWLLLYFCLPPVLGYLIGFPAGRPLWAKYFSVASPAFYLLVAVGLAVFGEDKGLPMPGKHWRYVGGVLTIGVIGVSIPALRSYYNGTGYSRYDYRPHIQYVEDFSLPSDALLTNPWTHFPTFWYYYAEGHTEEGAGPSVYFPLEWTDSKSELEAIVERHSGVWMIKNMPNDFDADAAIGNWLARHAFPTTTIWASNVRLRFYSVPAAAPAVQIDQAYSESPPVFGSQIGLSGYRIAVQPHKDSHILQLTLLWQGLEPTDQAYVVFAHLVDEEGQLRGQTDTPPLAGYYPTYEWAAGEQVEDHLGLLAAPGTLPGEYWVRLGLYRAGDGGRLAVSWPEGTLQPATGPAHEADNILLGPILLGRP